MSYKKHRAKKPKKRNPGRGLARKPPLPEGDKRDLEQLLNDAIFGVKKKAR